MAYYTINGVILSYPHLFVPKLQDDAKPGDKPRYSCMILVPQEVDIKPLEIMCFNLLREKFGENTETLLAAGMRREPSGLKWPFRKDNIKKDGSKRFDETKIKCFISPWSYDPVYTFDRYGSEKDANGRVLPDVIKGATPGKLYAGCFVNVTVNPYVYDNSNARGTSLGLVGVQHYADGERLDNRADPKDLFQAEERPAADMSAAMQPPAAGAAATGPRGAGLNDLFA